ncbi:MAG: NAD(P)/FAD-dependent oxidoreductase [Alicyclobacillus macrosporangiidus]|uniref:NAD(P)/FAD-dependent oxidoreductase n=1 Tax=Alicyclobacillus macrosporangiidus TaxID=392015 RepID=UPI0026ED60F5|nr:NAD(P)/FAD-dependent oxidoreductase [Alicyclobacillus macrosporangiidus]MCL6597153.1 NAD(P)/FAD-dependent oxidoreductase [Alicyclobacillus macrosporangiidus]
MSKHVVVLGAGYAGLQAALETRRMLTAEAARITVVNRVPYHQLITELHLPAAGAVSDSHVRLPLDKLLAGKNIDLWIGEVTAIRPDDHAVDLAGGQTLQYDFLVVALGSETEYFGIPGLKEHSFTLKSVEDANRIRDHVQRCLETYRQTKDRSYATFVVGGGGLTGIELVGELADALPGMCQQLGIDRSDVRLYCVEAMPTILPGFPEDLVARARQSLEARGVTFLTGQPVVQMDPDVVHLKNGDKIETKTMVWTGGVRGHSIVASSGIEVERRGRALINEYLQSTSHPDIFVVGDSAVWMGPDGRPFPPTAQLAGQMGAHVGQQLYALVKGGTLESFQPHLAGTLASLGRKDAIGMVGEKKRRVTGKIAAWLKTGSKLRWLADIGGLFVRA